MHTSDTSSGVAEDPRFGRMNDPTAAACVRGPCGDEMEFYLVIQDGVIEQVRYCTTGCADTKRCGAEVARRAQGLTVAEALGISPRMVIDSLIDMPAEGRHCAILAVTTLYRALADYLLAP